MYGIGIVMGSPAKFLFDNDFAAPQRGKAATTVSLAEPAAALAGLSCPSVGAGLPWTTKSSEVEVPPPGGGV
jgi:hypothetical protein